ncbi:DUF6270 domain-containing protein [Roseomonas sp. BN140053]|uniref:DUF6270 domain-containing protein n=1 Tax=Roseomonas sp. BN140053 TaxID=3391898 RepID=UPI0039E86A88
MMRAVESSPYRLAVLGSCATRDPLNHSGDAVEVAWYQARTCIPSMMASPRCFPDIQKSPDMPLFEQRNVQCDFEKSWRERLELEVDAIVLDFVDERFGAFEWQGSTFTFSTAFRQLLGDAARQMVERYINPTSGEYASLVAKHLDGFCERLQDVNHLIINDVQWANLFEDGSALPEQWHRLIMASNRLLDTIHERIARRTRATFLSLPKAAYVARLGHRWGDAPFHYTQATEERIVAAVLQAAGGLRDKRGHTSR